MDTQKVVFTIFLKFFGQKSENFLLKIRKNSGKKTKKKLFFRSFYSGHVDRILWAMPNVSAENPKRFKIFLNKIKVTKCSSGRAEGTFENFFEIFWPKVWKIFAQKSKKFWKENKKTVFFRNFCSGHLDRFLRTMPRVSAENPKRFKTLENNFKQQTIPLDT